MKYGHIILLLLFIHSCEAPRNNPLDPSNPDNIYHSINGFVKTQDIQREPIRNVKIYWPQQNLITKTNSNGFYSIEIVGKENGRLYCEKEGFWSDSAQITWDQNKKKTIQFFLNSMAFTDSLKLYSMVLIRHGLLPIERIATEVFIIDREKDVDSVYIGIPFKNVRKKINYNTDDKAYKEFFSLNQLNISASEELVGQDINIQVYENLKTPQIIKTGTIKRVIREVVEYDSPDGGEITTATPTLKWKPFNPGFEFTYMLEIYTQDTVPFQELIWRKKNISSEIDSFLVDIDLVVDDYYWFIWAIDEFGNRIRSKSATFKVK